MSAKERAEMRRKLAQEHRRMAADLKSRGDFGQAGQMERVAERLDSEAELIERGLEHGHARQLDGRWAR